jgi:hypothetical protein
MYIRFVILNKDPNSGRRQGLFHALRDLKDSGQLNLHEQARYNIILEWFNQNLEKPFSLARSRKTHAKSVALSWFKNDAKEHIIRMWELGDILKTHGIDVDMIRTDRPGYIVYEDEIQIAAEPFQETQT